MLITNRPVTRGAQPPQKNFRPLWKNVGRRLKLLDIVQKIWAPLRTLRPSCCPKLVTGLIKNVSKILVEEIIFSHFGVTTLNRTELIKMLLF